MAPPSATSSEYNGQNSAQAPKTPQKDHNGDPLPSVTAPLEPGIGKKEAAVKQIFFPSPPTFDDKYEERTYLKGRLAAAFRIFGKYGFDEGVAGHITCRVSTDCKPISMSQTYKHSTTVVKS